MRLRIEEVVTTGVISEARAAVLTIAPFDQAATAIPKDIGEGKGDLVGFSADSTPVRIPAGTIDGEVLIRDSASTAGVKFGSLGGNQRLVILPFDGGGAAIVPDTKVGIPWLLTQMLVEEWMILELSGAASYFEVLMCVDSYANFPATPLDDLVGIHLGYTRPKLNNENKAQATSVDWNDKTIENDKHIIAIASGYLGALTFSGAGLDDMKHGSNSRFTNVDTDINYKVEIDGTGTPDTFKWSDDGGSTWDATTVAITGADQDLNNGVTIRFGATTGHTATNAWTWTCRKITATQVVVAILGTPV